MNAKEEFLEAVEGRKIKCAIVKHYKGDIYLKKRHNGTDYKTFLDNLDFEYDNGYGGQELEGTIWFKDGTWTERGEYDGSEWWQHQEIPDIPIELERGNFIFRTS